MVYYGIYGGMHLIWWIVWMVLLFWIFATPYDIPGQRRRKDTPLGILQKRFAAGEITAEEYKEKKNILQKDKAD
ncbi:SHOCT domain-containing protein [Mucilaginibacter sp. AW1-7]|uniref:SHOCT domain-containing protein n=1 Tax=Mucilaginibacter sp. AW1-7 TaxID=3349874 RepID=UPI003F73B9CA